MADDYFKATIVSGGRHTVLTDNSGGQATATVENGRQGVKVTLRRSQTCDVITIAVGERGISNSTTLYSGSLSELIAGGKKRFVEEMAREALEREGTNGS